jgi:hypothetical protein
MATRQQCADLIDHATIACHMCVENSLDKEGTLKYLSEHIIKNLIELENYCISRNKIKGFKKTKFRY